MPNHSLSDITTLRSIIADNETRLIDRIIFSIQRQGDSCFKATPREAWRQSITGLSKALLAALEEGIGAVESRSNENHPTDPLTRFGLTEAHRQRERGTDHHLHLGLIKSYRQFYLDMVDHDVSDPSTSHRIDRILQQCFDRIEIGLAVAWNPANTKDHRADLQQANRSLNNQNSKYFSIFEDLQSPVAVLDRRQHIDTINNAWTTLFGNTTDSGTNGHTDNPINQTVTWLSTDIEPFVANGKAETTIEKRVETNLGHRYLCIKIKRILDDGDRYGGCLIMVHDVTPRRAAESAFQETIIWLTALFHALEEAVFIGTPNGRIVDTNSAAMRIFGYTAAELKNRPTEHLHVDRSHFKAFIKRVRDKLAKGEKAAFEYVAKRKNGDVFPAMVNIALLKKADGSPLGTVSIVRDISALKTAEEASQKNERLKGALELAGAVCHDMNQPLMAITGYADLILMDSPPEGPHLNKLRKIVDQVAKVGTITKKLMHVTRYETKSYMDQQIIDIERSSCRP